MSMDCLTPIFGMKSSAFRNAMKDCDGEAVVISAWLHSYVVCALVDPFIVAIPARAFYEHKKLAKLELCEGLIEIGEESF